MIYKFDSFTLDGWNLTRDGVLIVLPPLECQLLHVLVKQALEQPDIVVSKEAIEKTKQEIKNALWGDEYSRDDHEQALRNLAYELRKLLGDRFDGQPYIARRVFRLNAKVVEVDSESGRSPDNLSTDESTTLTGEAPQPVGVKQGVSPYPGAQSFDSMMTDKFFGRDDEIEALMKHINEFPIILIYAPSGAGKSSLLNTRIRQRLNEQQYEFMKVRVGGALPNIDENTEIRNIFTFSVVSGLIPSPNPRCRLDDCLGSIQREGDKQGRVLVLDQCEELFTKYPERFEHRILLDFFKEIISALKDDSTLRVIFAIRQEYLANILAIFDELAEDLSDKPLMKRFHLKRMDRENALEAITRPIAKYAIFAKNVAEEIVDQLNMIKVPRADGTQIWRPGEFVELVHLQIVCQRLWERLPPGITLIKMEHLDQVAGEPGKFKEFVVNALDKFYNRIVKEVADSEETETHGGYSQKLIFFGCMQFVTPALTRMRLRLVNGRVGRLPEWIVHQLVTEHLLVSELSGGERWYELAHDRLVEPVSRRKDPEVNKLLYAADLLEKTLGQAREKYGPNLKGCFEQHEEILRQCRSFLLQAGIFQDEVEFIFRVSLRDSSGEAQKWSQKLHKEYSPEVRLEILRDALESEWTEVRLHTAELLGRDPVDELLPELARLATKENEDASVRRAAAESLARLDANQHRGELVRKLFEGVFNKLYDPASQSRAEVALSRIRIAANWRGNAPVFETYFRDVSRLLRAKIRVRAFATQLWEGLPILLCLVIPAAFFAAIAAAAFKWLPSLFGWALTQTTANAGPGIFQGFTAGLIWAGGIVLGLTVYYIISEREDGSYSYLSQFYAIMVGTASGFIGSSIIVLVIVAVFNETVLRNMGWIMANHKRFSQEFWQDLFVNTRYAWPYLITGSGLGIGMALTTNWLRTSPEWVAFKEGQSQPTKFKELMIVIWGIMGILIKIRYIWPIPLMLLIAGGLAYFVPQVMPDGRCLNLMPGEQCIRSGALGIIEGLVGDCATQAVGAYFGIVGMGLGIVIVKTGFNLKPRMI
ncbi:MAG TPA: HEAT repeat domain-containing protein [Pyrinomonadaceae bacterium]|nr:HEAT repeat domain-containing protein [Pyrinomonadaceae bacterium]